MPKIDHKFLILFSIVLLVFLIASFHYYRKTVQSDLDISMVDFRVYYYTGFRLAMGRDIYEMGDGYFMFKYSPIFAILMGVIKYSTSRPAYALCVWYGILFISFLLSLYLIKEILFYPRSRIKFRFFDVVPLLFIFRYLILLNFFHTDRQYLWPLFLKIHDIFLLYILLPIYMINLFFSYRREKSANYLTIMGLAFLCIAKFVVHNIDRAQVNIVILLLLLFFTYYIVNKKEILAGVYLGIAIVFKLTPFIFLAYLFYKKRIMSLFSSMVTFLTLLFIPSFRVGAGRNIELLMGWIGALRATFPSEHLQHKNQSLMAMLSRYLSQNSDMAIVKLNDISLTIVVLTLYVMFLSLTVYLTRKRISALKDGVVYDLALFFVAMTILSPVGAKTTFVYLALPLALLIKEAFERKLSDKFINITLLIYMPLVYLNSSGVIGDLSITIDKYSLTTFLLLVIFVLMGYIKPHA